MSLHVYMLEYEISVKTKRCLINFEYDEHDMNAQLKWCDFEYFYCCTLNDNEFYFLMGEWSSGSMIYEWPSQNKKKKNLCLIHNYLNRRK